LASYKEYLDKINYTLSLPPDLNIFAGLPGEIYGWFYNNFEVVDLAFQRSQFEFLDWIDKNGGIYRHRWGDAIIRTLTVYLFSNSSRIRFYDNIGYHHYRRYRCPHPAKPCNTNGLDTFFEYKGPCDVTKTDPVCSFSWNAFSSTNSKARTVVTNGTVRDWNDTAHEQEQVTSDTAQEQEGDNNL